MQGLLTISILQGHTAAFYAPALLLQQYFSCLKSLSCTYVKPSVRNTVYTMKETGFFIQKHDWVTTVLSPVTIEIQMSQAERKLTDNNCLKIIAYLTFQTMKMLIILLVMHQFVGLPVQLQNRLNPIHYWYPEAAIVQVQLAPSLPTNAS